MKILSVLMLLTVLPLGAAESPSAKASAPQTEPVVTVGGQVRRPGPVPFHKDLTIYAAVQSAGGASEFGSMRRVKVIRDGKVQVLDLNKDDAKLVLVEKNDTIEVPQKNLIGR